MVGEWLSAPPFSRERAQPPITSMGGDTLVQ